MTVARILFLAKYRVPHACFALQWDHNLEGIDYTIVSSPVPKEELWPVFHKYGIDTTNFEYLSDSVIYERYPEINNWVFPDDYRGWWLRQQALKLSVLDHVQEEVMLMHDPDTFMIEPYRCYHDGKLNLLALMNTTQGSYEGVFESITGFPRTTPHCFVTELVPVRSVDWVALRNRVWSRWPDKHWLDSIIDAVPGMPTVPPWGNGNVIKWFSEYEFVGNWAVKQGRVEYQPQLRYEYDNLEKLANLTKEYNAVCDAVPDLSQSMQFDWHTLTVHDFDRYIKMVERALS
jgi:hypothetical protein